MEGPRASHSVESNELRQEEWDKVRGFLRSVRDLPREEQRERLNTELSQARDESYKKALTEQFETIYGESFDGEHNSGTPDVAASEPEPATEEDLDKTITVAQQRKEEIKKKRDDLRDSLTERYGKRGQRVEGTRGSFWLDSEDKAHIVRGDGHEQVISVNDYNNFGNRTNPEWRKWLGSSAGGWSAVSPEEGQEAYRRRQTGRTIREAVENTSPASTEAVVTETRDEKEARLRRELAELEAAQNQTPTSADAAANEPQSPAPADAVAPAPAPAAPTSHATPAATLPPTNRVVPPSRTRRIFSGFGNALKRIFRIGRTPTAEEHRRDRRSINTPAPMPPKWRGGLAREVERARENSEVPPQVWAWINEASTLRGASRRALEAEKAIRSLRKIGVTEGQHIASYVHIQEQMARRWKRIGRSVLMGASMGILSGVATTAFMTGGLPTLAALGLFASSSGVSSVVSGTIGDFAKRKGWKRPWMYALASGMATGLAAGQAYSLFEHWMTAPTGAADPTGLKPTSRLANIPAGAPAPDTLPPTSGGAPAPAINDVHTITSAPPAAPDGTAVAAAPATPEAPKAAAPSVDAPAAPATSPDAPTPKAEAPSQSGSTGIPAEKVAEAAKEVLLENPILAKGESVWGKLVEGIATIDKLSAKGHEAFADAFHHVVDDLKLQTELTGAGRTYAWTRIPAGTEINFSAFFSNADHLNALVERIQADYPTLAKEIINSGSTVDEYVSTVANAYAR